MRSKGHVHVKKVAKCHRTFGWHEAKIQKRVRCIFNVCYYTVFLHKMLASHRQPTFRDRRWTKYSNLEERIGRHPLPQMSKLKNVCVICHAVGFDLFCPPVSTLGRRKQLWNLGGAGDKVVQGLNNLSIYCIATLCVFIEPFSPVVQKGCVFARILATNATLCVFIEPFFTCRANRLCFYKDPCY